MLADIIIHLKYLQNTYYVLGTILDSWDIVVTNDIPDLVKFVF